MNKWTSGDFVSQGTKLHYYRTGGSKAPLVLLHGITDDGLCWTPVVEVLAENYDVIMLDARGHGKSDAPDEGYDYVTMAEEAAGLIEGLGLEKPVVMGHSMGGMTALTLAGAHPDLPRAVILEDPPALWRPGPPSQKELAFQAELRGWFSDLKRKTRDDLLETVRTGNPEWSEAEWGAWADAKHRFSLKIARLFDRPKAIHTNFPSLLRQITCPALLLTADPERGALLTDVDVAELESYVPHIQRTHIPGAGHSIRREQFSRYMEKVNTFLGQI